jgi:hypothetical protein
MKLTKVQRDKLISIFDKQIKHLENQNLDDIDSCFSIEDLFNLSDLNTRLFNLKRYIRILRLNETVEDSFLIKEIQSYSHLF